MSDSERVLQLLEEALESGRSPDEVCSDTLELLPEVRRRWNRCRQIEGAIEDLFPASSPRPTSSGESSPPQNESTLPSIPGYVAEEMLGRGGMGVVFRARHLGLMRPVALKMLLSGAYAGRVERARFIREAQAIASLRHAHILQVFDVGEIDGRPYFTMELLEGGSLAEQLAGVPRPPRDAAQMVATLADAVEAAHRAGIVHRDLKPGNILLAADGTPKISDFGLALRSEEAEADNLTLSGARIGTPCYMAPEQAAGRHGAIGPAADIYSLGAILYELLTGRPPFRGESISETERQLLTEEPAHPSKLNARVPRDLETICLKCLQKQAARRYTSMAALRDDLQRYLNGETVEARRSGPAERTLRWMRRRPAAALALAGGTLISLALAAGVSLFIADRANRSRAAEEDLLQAAQFRQRGAWNEAEAAIEKAAFRLGDRGSVELRARIEKARRESQLVHRLDAIAMGHVLSDGGVLRFAETDREFAAAFNDGGMGDETVDPATVAARIRDSEIRVPLTSAVFEWTRCSPGKERAKWLLTVARCAELDPTGWRDRIFDPKTWSDRAAMNALMIDPAVDRQSAELLLFVRTQLAAAGQDVVPFLLRIQRLHPDDFWTNFTVGEALRAKRSPTEAIRFLQAAVAIRPGAAIAHYTVGRALEEVGRMDEAIAAYGESLRIDPASTPSRGSMSRCLMASGRYAEAITSIRQALQQGRFIRSSDQTLVWTMLGDCYTRIGKDADAMEPLRTAAAMEGKPGGAAQSLATLRARLGQGSQVLAEWRTLMEASPKKYECADGFAECCLFLNDEPAYRQACGLLADRFGKSSDGPICECVGRTMLLLLPSADDLTRATAIIDRAVAIERAHRTWRYGYFMFAKGLAEYRAGRLESANQIMEGEASQSLVPAPQLVAAMAQARLGRIADAQKSLGRAAMFFDWQPTHANNREAWIYHILLREAQTVVLPNLPDLLAGRRQPATADERIAMLAACRAGERHATRARLWSEIFQLAPGLQTSALRTDAIKAAVLTGCGQGNDAAKLTEEDRARWREQARKWMRAEIVAVEPRPQDAKENSTTELQTYLSSPDLVGVRDPSQFSRFPATEQVEWATLWADVVGTIGRARAR